MSAEILPINEEIMILVKLPELAVDDVEVLVAKVICYLIYVVFILNKFILNNICKYRTTSTGWSKKKFMIVSVAYVLSKIDFSFSYSLSVYLNTQFVLSKIFFFMQQKKR